jgi:hypothetical protein
MTMIKRLPAAAVQGVITYRSRSEREFNRALRPAPKFINASEANGHSNDPKQAHTLQDKDRIHLTLSRSDVQLATWLLIT